MARRKNEAAKPPPPPPADNGDDDGGPTIDTFSERDQRIIVSQPGNGFLYSLAMHSKVE